MSKDMGALSGSRADASSPPVSTEGFDPARIVRRTLSKWGTAPLDGTPFHTLSCMRFNPFRRCFEALYYAEDGSLKWYAVDFSSRPPTWWLRLAPLPYELPSSFAFTITYQARRKTRRERLSDWVWGRLSKRLRDITILQYRALASAIEAGTDATGTGAAEGESAIPTGDAQKEPHP